jgi:hypothetical protein
MSTSCDVSFTSPAQARYAAEWGLASLLMGGTLTLLAGLALLLNLQLFLSGPVWAMEDLERLQNGSVWAGVVLIGLCVISLSVGVVGLVAAFRRCQPCALGLAGILMSLSAMTLWIVAVGNLHEVTRVMMIRQGLTGF